MAFMGIFLLAWFFMFIVIALVCVFVFVFIPCLIIFIINLVNGIRHKWPKRHLIPTIVTGIVLSIILAISLVLIILIAIARVSQGQVESTDSEAMIALHYLLQQINI